MPEVAELVRAAGTCLTQPGSDNARRRPAGGGALPLPWGCAWGLPSPGTRGKEGWGIPGEQCDKQDLLTVGSLDLTGGQRPLTCVGFLPETRAPQLNHEKHSKEILMERDSAKGLTHSPQNWEGLKHGEAEKGARTRRRRRPSVTWEERGPRKAGGYRLRQST